MKNRFNLLLLIFATVLVSCDKDFNTVGTDLIGDENFQFDKYEVQNIKAFSKATGDIQTNNLFLNQLGVYNDPYFGKTEASFVTQVSLSNTPPDFGTNPEIENVILYVPYFSRITNTDANGARTYVTDSIFNKTEKIKLSVYENGYFLNSLDPNDNFQSQQKFYSDLKPTIETFKRGTDAMGNSIPNGTRLNNSTDVAQNDEFLFSSNEIVVYKQALFNGVLKYVDEAGAALANQNDVSLRVVKERLAPGMYLELDKNYFKKLLLQNQASNLDSNTSFKNFFKGLYFKTEEITPGQGALAMINFSQAKISVNYQSLTGTSPISSKTYQLNLGTSGGTTVALLNNTNSTAYANGLAASNQLIGNDEKLYLKGGKGSVSYIELFNATELADLRSRKYLINDAFLTFYIDNNALSNVNQKEPVRLYLYDADNNRPLFDYSLDASTSGNSKYNKFVHDGIIQLDANKKGIKYRIRITQHINNVLNSTNTNFNKNVRLGLAVTENIGININSSLKNSITLGTDDIKFLPQGSVISTMGTVLYGPGSTDPNKKLKLDIYYTKPN
jgi:hypothetical protein